ncbi:imidazoleglycerol-phosphate dehydratase [Chthonomonas calidirosea]|uniref:Imidazoleglycerol-phosphate dehydratase n=1 Tax=Chthonomonas calidirosea (strain DSM 23976 / ICMP 18418 / T49) TaxID=1303518 RepID=S0EZZ6_CHTCT|nr:imidazoleglycerol-phosphate dehydratase HisB [Chthonomonas calidirosea]CCW36233.1 imidazoleglycerol-phosphate dehydratase [Chthonomonas calidirosea T49]CEK17943.1 imidazoleglycerol-phosphate dehydratase [Chthonomonas calidirosea]
MSAPRKATLHRKTAETDIHIEVALDAEGRFEGTTGVGFFDHMLAHIARHSLMNLTVQAHGDLHIDDHHTVEDTGIVLGQALAQALGDRSGIVRMGHAIVPMDEALVLCALDISGRGYLSWELQLTTPRLGDFTTEMVPEFFRAVALHAGWTIHLRQIAGSNTHHIIEATFKAFGRALAQACSIDPRVKGVPSTKGVL